MGADAVSIESFFEQNAVDGALSDEAMAKLLTGDLGDTVAPSTDSGDTPAPAPDTAVTKEATGDNAEPPAGDGKPDGGTEGDDEPSAVLAKDGKNIIPYEKLVEAREEAKAAREANQALMQEMESIKQALADLNGQQQGAPKAEEAAAATPQENELAELKEQLSDLPEVIAFVEKYTGSHLQQIDMLKQQIAILTSKLEPIAQTAEKRVAEDHFTAIKTAHADADAIVESKEFSEWMSKQPSFARAAYDSVLERGTTQQVIEMFQAFKDATQWGQTAPPASAGDTAQPGKPVKVVTPKSLSDIPAGSAPHHDEAEALTQMPMNNLIQKMMSMDPAKINEMVSRLV